MIQYQRLLVKGSKQTALLIFRVKSKDHPTWSTGHGTLFLTAYRPSQKPKQDGPSSTCALEINKQRAVVLRIIKTIWWYFGCWTFHEQVAGWPKKLIIPSCLWPSLFGGLGTLRSFEPDLQRIVITPTVPNRAWGGSPWNFDTGAFAAWWLQATICNLN